MIVKFTTGQTIRSSICAAVVGVTTIANSPHVLADERGPHAAVHLDMCQGCHGIAGYRTAFPEVYAVPKLGGQQAAYIVKALHDYKSGNRRHPTMQSIAATLSDEEITALAAYYSGGHQ